MSADVLRKLTYGVAIVFVLWIGSELLRGEPSDGVTVLETPSMTADDLDSIRIDRPQDDVLLVRRDSGWSVNGFDAGPQGVQDLVAALDDDLRLQLVARNATSYPRFDLTDDTARRLQVYRGSDPLLDLFVGKRGQDFQSVFVRRPDQDEVYSARTGLASLMDRRLDDWRDKRIAAIVPDSVARVDVNTGTGSYTLTRGENDAWTIDGAPANGASVNRMLEQFRALTAAGFPTEAQADSVDFSRPDRRIQVTDRSDRTAAELVFDSTATGFWVRKTGQSTVYRLDRFRVDQLTPADSTLREGNAD